MFISGISESVSLSQSFGVCFAKLALISLKLVEKLPGMRNVQLILFPEFQMLAYVLATEVLRVANKCAGESVFRWTTVSATGQPVHASNGVRVAPDTQAWEAGETPDLILLCAGYHPRAGITPGLRAYLARARRSGCTIGGLDTGTVVLAELGLLDGYRAVLHYEAEADFRENWPNIALGDQIYSLDRQRLTAAGGVATADALLAWIAREVGAGLAASTSEAMIHGRIRSSEEPQRDMAQSDPVLREMTKRMRAHLADPLSIESICHELGVSPKQLRRLCVRATGLTPAAWYLQKRLEEASFLLQHSLSPVTEIALATGFGSLSGFSRAFAQHFGLSPRAWRNSKTRRSDS